MAMASFLTARGSAPGPLFHFSDGRPLTRSRLVEQLHHSLKRANISTTGYSDHSFRIGAATTAAARGLEDSTIRMLGRWESSAYHTYIRTPRSTLAGISAVLSRAGQ